MYYRYKRLTCRFDSGYAAIPEEMKKAAVCLGKEVLGQVTKKKYLLIFHASENRQEIGQRLERFTMCVKMSECKRSGSIERIDLENFKIS